MTITDQIAKWDRLADFHAAKAAEGGDRASYYARLAAGERRRADDLRPQEG